MTLLLATLRLHKVYHIVENCEYEKLTKDQLFLEKMCQLRIKTNILLSSSFSTPGRILVNYFLMFLFIKFIFRGFVVKIEKLIRSEREKLIHK
jgi:hypothetical protein